MRSSEVNVAECSYCARVERAYNRKRTEPDLFTLHLDVEQIKGSVKKNEYKKAKLKEFEKKTSALRNTEGGDILIHLENQDTTDFYLGHVDDSVDAILKNLIPDGRLFTDVYTRRWLKGDEGFEEYGNVIVLTVEQSECVTTVDFKTKIPSDFMIENPSTLNIVSLLNRIATRLEDREPQLLDISRNLHESRQVEVKYLLPDNHTAETFVHAIWYKLRFREYLCSKSKVPSGGSYFVGIKEQSGKKNYESKQLDKVGFPKSWTDEEFEKCLHEKLIGEASFQTPDGQLKEVPKEILKYKFHESEKNTFILQIAIGFTNGIIFYNKNGPETYRIGDEREIVRMEHSLWLENIKTFSIKVAKP